MHILYPSNPLDSRDPDEQYVEESKVAAEMGFEYSIFSFEHFMAGKFRPIPELRAAETIVYRGWMMKPQDYLRFHDAICATGAIPLTSPQQYELCHHLPRWYPILEGYTPETLFFNEGDDLCEKLRSLSWTSCFLKDHVKSVATAGGSIARSLSEIPAILERMTKYRGEIEGGICARRIEDFDSKSESRHFVYQSKPFSRTGDTPELVATAARHILSPFFSVDVARRRDGVLRIIELGDGQVSDRKDWTAGELLKIFHGQPSAHMR